MRKVIVSNLISLDGFIAGTDGEIDWFVNFADKEFEEYSIALLGTVDTMLFGRVTYELMASYWPTATPAANSQQVIDAMNNSQKVVFSRTLQKVEWKNSRLVRSDIAGEVSRLKQQPGKNIVIYGSGAIVSALTRARLIDEYRIFVCPVALGGGIPQFKGIKDRLRLSLKSAKSLGSGLVAMNYVPSR